MSTESIILLLAIFIVAIISFIITKKQNHHSLREKCNQLETNIALSEQTIANQTKTLEENTAFKKESIIKLEAANIQFNKLTASKAELENGKKEKSEQLEEYKKLNKNLRNELDEANSKIAKQEVELGEQKITVKTERDKLTELKEQFEKQKTDLKIEFKVVSEEIIKERQQSLNEQNKEGIGALLKPLQEQIVGFQKRVNEVHTDAVKGNTNLEAEIKKVLEIGLTLQVEANNLTSALKGDSQQRGAWGEAQLERTLEMSGLIDGTHYEKHSPFKDQAGKQKQTDYLIKLPDKKHIIIDSKVSLIDYEKSITGETEEIRSLAMQDHIKSVKKHIDDLASKDYTNLPGMHSPTFVLMFMPIEPAFIEALKQGRELFGYGFNKNIIMVSHTTLIPILRTVANLWMLDQSNTEAKGIVAKAGEIYNSVCIVAERFKKLGNTLNTASTQYNTVYTALTGKQGLHGRVERFTQLSNKVTKEMPKLEPLHFECETTQLEIKPIALVEKTQHSDELQTDS